MPTQKKLQSNRVLGLRRLNQGFGLPSSSKFQTGHLPPGKIRVSRAIHVSGSGSNSGSDMDTGSDSDDQMIPNSLYTINASKTHGEFSSSKNVVIKRKQRHFVERLGGAGPAYRDDEPSEWVSSSEVSSRLLSSRDAGDQSRDLLPNIETLYKQGCWGKELQNKILANGDAPSAPPLGCGSGSPCPESSSGSGITDEANLTKRVQFDSTMDDRISADRFPTYHASGLGPWHDVIAYDACVRLCLHSWSMGCKVEPPFFLKNECELLRNAFRLQHLLLQPEKELLSKQSMELVSQRAGFKHKNTFAQMKVQVRKVKMGLDPPTGCSFSSLKQPIAKLLYRLSYAKSTLTSELEALREVRLVPHIPENGSFSRKGLAYVYAGTQYMKEVSGLLKIGVSTFRTSSSSYEEVQETYSCSLRLKSLREEDAVRMQPGSGETHVFLPDGPGDDLVVEAFDSKGRHCGRVVAKVADIAEDPRDKLRWWPMYHEPEHELVGRVQLSINYSTSLDKNSHVKCGSVSETVVYDLVLEAAMKAHNFRQRNLLLQGSWSWLLTEFALFYGVSNAYTNLRYLSKVMEVSTPTAYCLNLVHDLLLPVVNTDNIKCALSRQENRILGDISDQIEQTIALVFENYKSLDESSISGMMDIYRPPTNFAAPALEPALKLYSLLHDILSSEVQLKLCRYFQTAVRKRSRRSLAETDEFVSGNNKTILMDPVKLSTAYQKMVSLCFSIRNEIFTDIEIHNQYLLPSFIDLPNLSSSIYSTELCNRLRAFLCACPPAGPAYPVMELVIATHDFQRDLTSWNINPTKGSVNAKELFHSYIIHWIQDKNLALLELCKLDQVKLSGIPTAPSTTPFVDNMYNRLKEMLGEYDVIIRRWPEYVCPLENAIADVERAIVETLDKQYTDVLSPLKDSTTPIKVGFKYVQKIAKGNVCPYTVPDELGILLNSMKRMLDVLQPKIEDELKSWSSCIPDGGNNVPGERLSEVTVMLRTKFRNYVQAVVEKLAENTRLHRSTRLKNIIQDAKENVGDSDVRSGMQPLKDLLTNTIDHLHSVVQTRVLLNICGGFWDRMGKDVLKFLENKKESGSCYNRTRVALSVLDDTFASRMQQLVGNSLHENNLEPPRSIMEARSMLRRDAGTHKDNNYFC